MWCFVPLATLLIFFDVAHGFVMSVSRGSGGGGGPMSRREAVHSIAASSTLLAGVLVARPPSASAGAAKINKALGQESFRKIRDTRQYMDRVDAPLSKREFEEVQALMEGGPPTELEKSLVDLLKSNVLPSDDKIAVGTIRRYGLAADALIAMGGLSAAVRDEEGSEARRMLILTKESLNDILTIGVNNNLNKTN